VDAYALKVIQNEIDPDSVRHREEMQHRVGRTPRCHDDCHCVLKRFLRHDIPRLDVVLEEVKESLPGRGALGSLFGRLGGGGRRSGKRHPKRLDR
jgi:hypothetical protein